MLLVELSISMETPGQLAAVTLSVENGHPVEDVMSDSVITADEPTAKDVVAAAVVFV